MSDLPPDLAALAKTLKQVFTMQPVDRDQVARPKERRARRARRPEFRAQGPITGERQSVTPQRKATMKPSTVRIITACAIVFALSVAAFGARAEDPKPAELTVEQALNVAAGLEQINSFETVDKDGKPTKGYYKFSADLRIVIALNIDVGRAVQARFATARNAVIMQISDGTGIVSEEKKPLATMEVDKLMKVPSRAGYVRIKMSDLRLDENTTISGQVISLLLPILDR